MISKNNPNELSITRLYDAPVKMVWEAWTDPLQVAQWWGPRGFSITTHSKDLKPGGHWSYTMHGPDGTDYPNKTLYHEVQEFRKLVYDHGGNDDRPPLFRITVLFSETEGKTKMDLTMALATAEAAKQTAQFIKQAEGNATWDRLAEYLEKESSGTENFVINRTFEASRELLFELWTEPEHLAEWLPPTGFHMEFLRADIRVDGSAFYSMSDGNGTKFFGRFEYQKIQKPELIVYTQQFCDEQGNVSRHPLAPTWPETMLTTVKLTEEAPDRTRVTVSSEPFGKTTTDELAIFVQARSGMTQGWTGSFDKLEERLEQLRG